MADVYSGFKIHDQLDQTIWDGMEMRPKVREKLLAAATEFYTSLGVSTAWEDVILVGSMANYNYSRFSDLDVHLILDFYKIDENWDLVYELLRSKKVIWNEEHQIMIRGHEVEMYTQDLGDEVKSDGIYSILHSEWIDQPSKDKPTFDISLVRRKAEWLMNLIDDAMESPNRLPELERIKDKIKRIRHKGLAEEGEFSESNLAFKVLRRTGYLDKLWGAYQDDLDQVLSLEVIFR